jgi:hypothetical protein
MLAAITQTPELVLDKDEARKLSDAAAEVARQYAVAFDPRKVAVVNLFATAGFIYGPRIVAWRQRRKNKAILQKPAHEWNRDAAGAIVIQPKPGDIKQPPPPPKVNSAPAPQEYAPSQLWPEGAADFPGVG